MISIERALRIVRQKTIAAGSERVPLRESVGRILAEDIVADMDLPPFDRSQMDGFAVIAADTEVPARSLKIVGESAAGKGWNGSLAGGSTVRIMTGGRVPAGADAVLRLEHARETGNEVHISKAVNSGTSIVRRGAEVRSGTRIFGAGELIGTNMVAVLAAFGYKKVRVGKRPRISILGTGSEIVDYSRKPGRDQIRNSNSIMLDVLCRQIGAEPSVLPIVKDRITDLTAAIKEALGTTDMLIITGGVSVGKYDHTKTALTELGAEIFFDRIRLKPGKPTVFAKLAKMLIFGLPGNPVSAATAFQLLVGPALRLAQGARSVSLDRGWGIALNSIKGTKERDSYLPCKVEYLPDGGIGVASVKTQGSSDLVAFAAADCLAFVPRGDHIDNGSIVNILHLPKP